SELFNSTHELIRWAQRSNLVSVLTDCPHRERLGWLEQYHLNGPSLRYEFDLGRLFRKTFQDMTDAQTQEGLVPSIAPEYIIFEGAFRDSPEWGSALILAAWQQYVFTGDTSVLEKYYANMKSYFGYLGSKAEDHLLDYGLGDWYDIGPDRPGVSQLTPIGLTASATYYEDAIRLADIADILGDGHAAAQFRDEAGEIRAAFNRKYYKPEEHSYATGSQTANAMAYVLGLVPSGDEEKVLQSIIKDIRSRGNGFTSGDVGHRYLLMALAKGNRPDVVFDMHHQSDRPGYGYQLKMGATSLTEAWDAGPHSSQNHFMLGHIMEWFYHDLVGIAPVAELPGFGLIDIKPQPVAGLSFARARIDSVRGPVSVEWKREKTVFVLEAEIPANARALIQLPARAGQQVRESSVPVAERQEIQFVRQDEAYRVYTLPSGHYRFEVEAL
ncbi:MAG TPA: alpha-L-rhamnosidase C-terminal domain-containing protein, partial [Oceanipulchritudo sp.]|nr:alpha-L-rhamnosidase C-terminal domain-containing protein [Oceanipulchritudo sp.]